MRAPVAAVAAVVGIFAASGCAGSGPHLTAHYTTPPETTGGVSLESPRVRQIELARASNRRVFAIFPAAPGRKRCLIPEGGVHLRPTGFHGICETSIRSAPTHEPALIVTFTETWKRPCPRGSDCIASPNLRHTWQVVEGEPMVTATARLRVVATRTSGATAPQYYK